ncbi:MAG: CYTH domain-containing protein [Rhodospirillaceae bacterium]
MSVEIERKFLVDAQLWRPAGKGVDFRQGYLSSAKERVVRVRLAAGHAFLTIKGATRGVTRSEFEYEIPVEDAVQLLELCERPLIEKTRYTERHGDHDWEIDVFRGDNDGLVLAEVELAGEHEVFLRPAWLGAEVSHDARYYNANLIKHPYTSWK